MFKEITEQEIADMFDISLEQFKKESDAGIIKCVADNYVPIEQLKQFKEYYDKQEGQKYPCSNQIVKCGIITKDVNLAMDFMKSKNATMKLKRKDEIIWELDNGEQWIWRNWTGKCRGYRFYKVAIDKFIDKDLFDYFVRPYCSLYCCSVEII